MVQEITFFLQFLLENILWIINYFSWMFFILTTTLEATPKEPSQLYIDYELDKPHWGWSWLEWWMVARPWENHVFNANYASKDVFDGYSVKNADGNFVTHVEESECGPKQRKSLVKQKKLVPHSRSTHNESWTLNQGLHIVLHLCSILSNENSHSHCHQSSITLHCTTRQGTL